MGGIDISDQISSAHSNDHKPNGLFWRRKIDSMEQVSITNTFLFRGMWAKFTKDKIDKELEKMGPESLPDTVVVSGEARGMTEDELLRCRETCERVDHIEKEVWDRKLSQYLMAKCRRGKAAAGGNRAHPARNLYNLGPGGAKWEKPLHRNRVCDNPGCKRETRGACRCSVCRESGIVICTACFMAPKKHREAAEHRRNTFRNPPRSTELKRHRAKKRIPWENLVEQLFRAKTLKWERGKIQRMWRGVAAGGDRDRHLLRTKRT